MADELPTTLSFGDLVLEVENDGAPGTYTARLCGVTQKGVDMSAQTSTAKVPPCNNPTAPAWNIAGITTLGGKVTLNGVYAAEDSSFWNKWYDSGQAKNVRIREVGVGFRAGPALLTGLSTPSQLDQDASLAQRAITLDNAGAWPWTDGDPA
jgi:hypothetical protein